MKAEIYIVDEKRRLRSYKPTLIEPIDVRENGVSTTYTFAFEFSIIDEDAFDKIMEEYE